MPQREHDFTRQLWGHNLDIISWDRESRTGRAACWVTPGLRDGDVVIVKSERGSMRLIAFVCTAGHWFPEDEFEHLILVFQQTAKEQARANRVAARLAAKYGIGREKTA